MFKTKIVEKIVRVELFLSVIGQLWSIGRHSKTRFFQNWIIRNTHCHQTFDFYEIAELRKTWVSQFEAILRMIAQIVVFFRANCCFFRANRCFFFRAKLMRKERKILRFVPQKLRKSFANGNPRFSLFLKKKSEVNLLEGLFNA